jgi:flagellar assembly factor FliW
MPQCDTKYFGKLSYEDGVVLEFPAGLPGFERCRYFLAIDDAAQRPLLFLQSLEEPVLCFITLPVAAFDPGYCLKMSAEDVAAIGLARQPAIGAEALCLAVVSMAGDGVPTANLLAPIVVNPRNGRAVQSVRDDSAYGCRHALAAAPEVAPCS